MTESLDSLFSLEGRSALITGGNGGVGAMLARGLLIAGARVMIAGRDEEKGRETVGRLSEFGECRFLRSDLASAAGIDRLAAETSELMPGLDVLVNNAGVNLGSESAKPAADEFDLTMSLNVRAPFLLVRALQPVLKSNASAQRPAHIVNTGSIAGISTDSLSDTYGPSKAALHHLTKMLARRLAPDHIHVNAIAPGLFHSDMTAPLVENEQKRQAAVSRIPVGHMGEADDLATLVIALISNGYMTGCVIPLDGGMSCK